MIPLLTLILSFAGRPAIAQVFLITNNGDSGTGSLRQAVLNADGKGGSPTIAWASSDGGTITLGSNLPSVAGSITIDASGAASAATIAGSFDLPLGGPITLINNTTTQAFTISAIISSTGSLVVGGSGRTVLSGVNTYSGGTTVNGTLAVTNSSSIGTGALNLSGGLLQTQAGVSLTNTVNLSGFTGVDTAGKTSTLSGAVGGSGILIVTDSVGGGKLTLTGANSYTGGTLIAGGTGLSVSLQANALNTLSSGLVVMQSGTGHADLGVNASQTVGSLAGDANSTVEINGSSSLTVGSDNSNTTFAGSISGTGSLSKGGTGTFVLSGNNTFSGGLTVTAGTLGVASAGSLGSTSGSLTLGNATLQTQGNVTNYSGLVNLLSDSATIDMDGRTSSFTGTIVGSTLTVIDSAGGGTLVLTDTNSYIGGTHFVSGTLGITNNSSLGSGPLNFDGAGAKLQTQAGVNLGIMIKLNANGVIDLDGHNSFLNGQINGSSSLTIEDSVGTGSVSIGTANTFSGGTNILSGKVGIAGATYLGTGAITFYGGTLQTQQGVSGMANNIILKGVGTVDADGSASIFSGVISGTGTLKVADSSAGGGSLTLRNVNTWTGGTIIDGTSIKGVSLVSGGSGSLGSGGVKMVSGTGQALLNINGNVENIGSLSGDALSVVQLAKGLLTVGSDNTSTTYAGVISDGGLGGILTKSGTGTLALGGVSSYTGGTNVNGGTVQLGVTNALAAAGALNVGSGAVFDLNGFNESIGATTNNGTVNARTGLLTVNGNYTGTGALDVVLQPAVTNLTATGKATVTGQTLNLSLQSPGAAALGGYTVINAGSVAGQFASIVAPAYMSATPTYTATTVVVGLTQDFPGQTTNQNAVAGALNGITKPVGDVGTVFNQLFSMNLGQIQTAMDQIGPVALGAMSGISFSASGVMSAAVSQRLAGLQDGGPDGGRYAYYTVSGQSGSPGTLLAYGGSDLSGLGLNETPGTGSPWGFFLSGLGTFGTVNSLSGGSGTQPGYDFSGGGVSGGADYWLDDHLVAGVSVAYLTGSATIDSGLGSVGNKSVRFGAYGTAYKDDLYANLYLGGAADSFDTTRNIPLLSRTATSSPGGKEFNMDLMGGTNLRYEPVTLSPFVGLSYDHLGVDSFSESGAGSMDLSVGSQTAESLRSRVGVRASKKYERSGYNLTPYASIGWQHEYENQARAIDAQLASGVGSAFSVTTADIARDAALLGVGVVADWGARYSFKLAYSGQVSSDLVAHTVSGSLRLRF